MLDIGIGIDSTATKIAVLDESGAVVDVDVRPADCPHDALAAS